MADARAFASLFRDAELTVLSCGHTLPFEAPVELATVVRNLRDQIEAGGSPG